MNTYGNVNIRERNATPILCNSADGNYKNILLILDKFTEYFCIAILFRFINSIIVFALTSSTGLLLVVLTSGVVICSRTGRVSN